MIDVIFICDESTVARRGRALIQSLSAVSATGAIYFGHPILVLPGRAANVDALLISREFGLVAFDLGNANGDMANDRFRTKVARRQDEIYAAITSKLRENNELVRGRALALQVNVVTLHNESSYRSKDGAVILLPASALPEYLASLPSLSDYTFRVLNIVIHRMITISPKG